MDRTFPQGERDGQRTNVVVASRIYPHPQAAVWAAFASADRLSRWFVPVTGDLRQGGRFQFQGNAGGLIEVCDKPDRIAATWEFGGGISWVELTFITEDMGTRVILRHIGRAVDLPPGMWDQYGPGAVGVGWELGFIGLGLHLDAPDAPRPPDFAVTWSVSDEGKAVIAESAKGWAAAAIAGGEDAALMDATVPRLFSFYTGLPAPE